MVDTPGTVVIAQAGGGPDIIGLTVIDDQGRIAFQAADRANGDLVTTDNPKPMLDAAALINTGSILAIQEDLLTLTGPANSVNSTPITVGTTSTAVAAAGTMARGWAVQDTVLSGAGYIDLCWGTLAVLGLGFYRLFPGSSQNSGGLPPPPPGTAMSAIASAPGQTMVITVFD